jgi:hypothetical protein
MSYKLVCVYEFFDEISGTQVVRGQEIYDYNWMAQLVAANREHHFNKVWLVMSEAQWDWPPVIKEPPPPPPAAEPAKAAAEVEAE